jgi:hypothetical protein
MAIYPARPRKSSAATESTWSLTFATSTGMGIDLGIDLRLSGIISLLEGILDVC